MFFDQMPSAGRTIGIAGFLGKRIGLAVRIHKRYGAVNRIAHIDLPADHVFPQNGELASSKSAIKTLAPELKALMTIFRSLVGPVISTLLS